MIRTTRNHVEVDRDTILFIISNYVGCFDVVKKYDYRCCHGKVTKMKRVREGKRSNKRRVNNRLIIWISPIKIREICWIHVLEDHEGVAIRRRQFDFGSRENRIEVFGHPGIFLHTTHNTGLRNR